MKIDVHNHAIPQEVLGPVKTSGFRPKTALFSFSGNTCGNKMQISGYCFLRCVRTMRIRPFDKKYWEQLSGPITGAEFGAASIEAIKALQAGKGRKKVKRAGRQAIYRRRGKAMEWTTEELRRLY